MIDLGGIRKRYGRARARTDAPEALRGVTLTIEPGAVTAVVGPNGAGKTTLFGIALGFLLPSAGEATIEGYDPRDWLRRNGAGWLPERFAPPPPWRVGETVQSLAALDRRPNASAEARTLLERFGLGPHLHRRVGDLSRGLLQRVGIAQALVGQHRLIVLDEPTGGLDPEGRTTFREALSELRQREATVLLASHDIAEIERTADRVVLLDQGTVRDVVAARTQADYTRFRLVASAPDAVLRSAFPDAQPVPLSETGEDAETMQRVSFTVAVPDVTDLNRRLATFIATGGVVFSIEPAGAGLEIRIAELRSDQQAPGSS